jgi:hypothetical protein
LADEEEEEEAIREQEQGVLAVLEADWTEE